jgi:hypothetical protein
MTAIPAVAMVRKLSTHHWFFSMPIRTIYATSTIERDKPLDNHHILA